MTSSDLPTPLPFVGRATERHALQSAFDHASGGRGSLTLLAGEAGIGKTRLVGLAIEQARSRRWNVATGSAYAAESGIPYALFADALVPLLRSMDTASLTTLSRGGMAELTRLFPTLAAGSAAPDAASSSSDGKARLFSTFTEFVGRLAKRRPTLLALDNLQWADAASLELLHFLARQIGEAPLVIVCTYDPGDAAATPTFRMTEQSLLAHARPAHLRVERFTAEESLQLLEAVFGTPGIVPAEFAALVYGRTRGNPFFLEQVLKQLVASGELRRDRGVWLGWDRAGRELPPSVRDAISVRIATLSPEARAVGDLLAVLGVRASLDALRAVSGNARDALFASLQELLQRRIIEERAEGHDVVLDFVHPMLRDVLYAELGPTRAQAMHASIAEALERLWGAHAADHAGELAYHLVRAGTAANVPMAVAYLTMAGRAALATHADREAAAFLDAALTTIDRAPGDTPADAALIADLALAQQRLGDLDASTQLWSRARQEAASRGDLARVAVVERRLGLVCFARGQHARALEHYEAGLVIAQREGLTATSVLLRIAAATSLMDTGRTEDASGMLHEALTDAQRIGDRSLEARAHRAMLLVTMITCDVRGARDHAEQALALAEESQQPLVSWSARWALAVVAGLTGDAAVMQRHLAEADRIADALHSPVLRLWNNEVTIEFDAAMGRWDAAITRGEHSIALARSLGQRTLLIRLLVWTGITYVGRGALDRANACLQEAWTLSGAGATSDVPRDVTGMLRAHMGLTIYHTAAGDYPEAVRIGAAGLALADRSGQMIWCIYRLLPAVIEAHLRLERPDPVPPLSARLREESERVGHRLGIAWAAAADALVDVQRHLTTEGVDRAEAAADQLEAFPYVFDAARLRLVIGHLRERCGDVSGAIRVLTAAHRTFEALGAERARLRARAALERLGARVRRRVKSDGHALRITGTEFEIAMLVAERLTNKEIAARTGKPVATVRTHVGNALKKLGIHRRAELGDLVRSGALARR